MNMGKMKEMRGARERRKVMTNGEDLKIRGVRLVNQAQICSLRIAPCLRWCLTGRRQRRRNGTCLEYLPFFEAKGVPA